MNQWQSTDELLDFAIKEEEDAAAFYRDLAATMKVPAMQATFEQFAAEEDGHKAKLQNVKRTDGLAPTKQKVLDLKIGDYLVDIEPGPDLTYQEVLILAMKKEKAAFKMYTDLAAATDDADLQSLLLGLAQEEAKHKLRFEIEYDDEILREA